MPHRTTHPHSTTGSNNTTQPHGTAQPHRSRARTTSRAAATITALLAILLTTLAIPAQAATSSSGTGQTHHPVASRRANHSDGLTVGALSLAGIVATAAGVLWYTARTRRTIDSDAS